MIFYILFMANLAVYHAICLVQVRQYAHETKFSRPGQKSVAYIFYGWCILFSAKEALWSTMSILFNITLMERNRRRIPPYFVDQASEAGYTNVFDKGVIKNLIEVFISTFSNSGLSRKVSSLDIMDDADNEDGNKATFDSLIDYRIHTEPLNWSKTFLCGILEIDCPTRDDMIRKIEFQKKKLLNRGFKTKNGHKQDNINISSDSDVSDESDEEEKLPQTELSENTGYNESLDETTDQIIEV